MNSLLRSNPRVLWIDSARTLATLALAVFCIFTLASCNGQQSALEHVYASKSTTTQADNESIGSFSSNTIPPYSGKPSVEVNDNVPYFSNSELEQDSFESYSELDSLGRCGPAYALIGPETMPHSERGSIGMIKPSGWQISEYEWIDGKYLFNRCHLIAFSLAGENDNELNLITGTRSMNTQGMLPYEESIATYVDTTSNHVLYRVTPVFEDDNLIASGVLMEAESIEDQGAGIRFCIWCYNVEPGIVIDYSNGDNHASDAIRESEGPNATALSQESANAGQTEPKTQTYILNTNTHRFHRPNCPSVADIKEKNRESFEGTREEAIERGYEPCGACKP